MPQREKYFAQPPVELLRQVICQGGWYDRKALSFRKIIDKTFVAAMGPPGGGRNPITERIKRWFNIINYTELGPDSMTLIFNTILENFFKAFGSDFSDLSGPMIASTIDIYQTIQKQLLPTPAKSHYTFNLRDLAKVIQGVLMGDPKKVETPLQMVRLFSHEVMRVFEDRLINYDDKGWLQGYLKESVERSFNSSREGKWEDVFPRERLFYGDYMIPGAEPRIYAEVEDEGQLIKTVEEYLFDYNEETKNPMNLVMFLDAIEHVSRISRVLRQPLGNALLLGVGGSGRQSLTRLASAMADFEVSQVEVAKGYGMVEWREDVKECLLKAGLKDHPVVFLFNDTQIVDEQQVEDINNILNSGDLPNLYAGDEMDKIMSTCRVDCQKKRITPTKINIFSQYILRVRRNIHIVFCMSPLGDAYRDRLVMFPSLVNCCTIDWFMPWPEQALVSVAQNAITAGDYKLGDHQEGVVQMFKTMHQAVEVQSAHFLERMRRHAYVTPTSYLELLSSYTSLLVSRRAEVDVTRSRLSVGVDKIKSTKEQVAGMQEQLTALGPQLVVTQKEVEEMMIQITKDKADAAETKKIVEKEEAVASKKAAETKAIADDAQRDLDEALPALDAAVQCLSALKKADIDEVKSLGKPPGGVVLTAHAACIMFEVKGTKIKDPDNPTGPKIDDYWKPAKDNLFKDAKAFMSRMIEYDKDNISHKVIKKIEPFTSNPDFTPKAIEKASKACT